MYHSASEFGWSETYIPLSSESEGSRDGFDLKCIEAISDQCRTFVDHHPHKLTGTDILIVLNSVSDFPEQFLRKFFGSKINNRDPRVRLHILAEPSILSGLSILREEDPLFGFRDEFQLMPFIDISAHC